VPKLKRVSACSPRPYGLLLLFIVANIARGPLGVLVKDLMLFTSGSWWLSPSSPSGPTSSLRSPATRVPGMSFKAAAAEPSLGQTRFSYSCLVHDILRRHDVDEPVGQTSDRSRRAIALQRFLADRRLRKLAQGGDVVA
jgi:hypothetical protein